MAMNKPLIVTALYDIGRDNWDNFKMSYHTYCWWMRNTLSIDNNIVIYTEEKFVNEIETYRKEFDPQLVKTKIIVNNLKDLDAYIIHYNKLNALMNDLSFKSKVSFPDVPEMCQPLYNIIMFNKIYFINDAIKNNYFENDCVIWADAGGLREDVINYKGCEWPNVDKLSALPEKIIFFSHNNDFVIHDKEFYSMSQIRNLQGTCFIVPSKNISFLIEAFNNAVESSISSGFIGSDEKMFDICYTENKDMFYLIKSSWREYFDILK